MKTPPEIGWKVFWYDYDGTRFVQTVKQVRGDIVEFKDSNSTIHYRALAGRIVKKERIVWWISRNRTASIDRIFVYTARKFPPVENEKHLWIKVIECREGTG